MRIVARVALSTTATRRCTAVSCARSFRAARFTRAFLRRSGSLGRASALTPLIPQRSSKASASEIAAPRPPVPDGRPIHAPRNLARNVPRPRPTTASLVPSSNGASQATVLVPPPSMPRMKRDTETLVSPCKSASAVVARRLARNMGRGPPATSTSTAAPGNHARWARTFDRRVR